MSGIVVLTGGVGGAKLVHGLTLAAPHTPLMAVVNTGDDFVHLGLHISPDIDTILYTLSGKANKEQGWGREGETWHFMQAVKSLGAEHWFNLGDADLALHVVRSERLRAGEPLSAITDAIARAWSIGAKIVPATDDPLMTIVNTDQGALEFQRYFVDLRCAPRASGITFKGAKDSRPAPGVLAGIARADVILIAPSNPYLSVDPILAVPGIAEALRNARAPVVAVLPLIGGQSIKGPTSKLMEEFGVALETKTIALHYHGLIDALLIDCSDTCDASEVVVGRGDILMKTDDDRRRVASAALDLARSVSK